jgi:hypothetical protein
MTYQDALGTAYNARAGACVYGADVANAVWNQYGCQTGNFTVLKRVIGTQDTSTCDGLPNEDMTETMSTRWVQLDVVLCLSYNYRNAAGHARIGTCLLMTGSGSNADFENVADCSLGNIIVTGRVGQYDDIGFCGSGGWATGAPAGFPNLDFTICFRSG